MAANDKIRSIVKTEIGILLGGDFTLFKNTPANRIILVDIQNQNKLELFDYGSGFNDSVNKIIILDNDKILIGGNFTSYKSISTNRITCLNFEGNIDNRLNFGSGFNNRVNAIAAQKDSKLVIGGAFTSYNGQNINRIIRLNPDGSIDDTFNIGVGFNGNINTIVIQDDQKILIGGAFTSYKGQNVNKIVRLNPDGSIDNTFNIGVGFTGGDVYTILNKSIPIFNSEAPWVQIFVGGSFTSYKNTPKTAYLTKMDNSGNTIPFFQTGVPIFNNTVFDLQLDTFDFIIVGGEFTEPKNGLLVLNSNSGELIENPECFTIIGECWVRQQEEFIGNYSLDQDSIYPGKRMDAWRAGDVLTENNVDKSKRYYSAFVAVGEPEENRVLIHKFEPKVGSGVYDPITRKTNIYYFYNKTRTWTINGLPSTGSKISKFGLSLRFDRTMANFLVISGAYFSPEGPEPIGIHVSYAGNLQANGSYFLKGVFNNLPYFILEGCADDPLKNSISWSLDNKWVIRDFNGDIFYESAPSQPTSRPWDSSLQWFISDVGIAPIPKLVKIQSEVQSIYVQTFFLNINFFTADKNNIELDWVQYGNTLFHDLPPKLPFVGTSVDLEGSSLIVGLPNLNQVIVYYIPYLRYPVRSAFFTVTGTPYQSNPFYEKLNYKWEIAYRFVSPYIYEYIISDGIKYIKDMAYGWDVNLQPILNAKDGPCLLQAGGCGGDGTCAAFEKEFCPTVSFDEPVNFIITDPFFNRKRGIIHYGFNGLTTPTKDGEWSAAVGPIGSAISNSFIPLNTDPIYTQKIFIQNPPSNKCLDPDNSATVFCLGYEHGNPDFNFAAPELGALSPASFFRSNNFVPEGQMPTVYFDSRTGPGSPKLRFLRTEDGYWQILEITATIGNIETALAIEPTVNPWEATYINLYTNEILNTTFNFDLCRTCILPTTMPSPYNYNLNLPKNRGSVILNKLGSHFASACIGKELLVLGNTRKHFEETFLLDSTSTVYLKGNKLNGALGTLVSIRDLRRWSDISFFKNDIPYFWAPIINTSFFEYAPNYNFNLEAFFPFEAPSFFEPMQSTTDITFADETVGEAAMACTSNWPERGVKTVLEKNGNIKVYKGQNLNNQIITIPISKDWVSIAISEDGRFQTAIGLDQNTIFGKIYTSNDFGDTWSLKYEYSIFRLKKVAMNSNGQFQTIVTDSTILISNDYGENWTIKSINQLGNFTAVAINGRGNMQLVCTSSVVYSSFDYGVSWSQDDRYDPATFTACIGEYLGITLNKNKVLDNYFISIISKYNNGSFSLDTGSSFTNVYFTVDNIFNNITCKIAGSFNGVFQTLVANGNRIYISKNYGATWSRVEDESIIDNKNWKAIAVSEDGKYQTAVVSSEFIYVSNNFGENWEARDLTSRNWSSVAMTKNGEYQFATVDGGKIYKSNNYGSSWVLQSLGLLPDINRNWKAIAVSEDGQHITALSSGDGIYLSNNSGQTWSKKTFIKNWMDIDMSLNGQFQSAVAFGDKIYISTDYGNNWIEKASIQNWTEIGLNDTGEVQIAINEIDDNAYISRDYGINWELLTNIFTISSLYISKYGFNKTTITDSLNFSNSLNPNQHYGYSLDLNYGHPFFNTHIGAFDSVSKNGFILSENFNYLAQTPAQIGNILENSVPSGNIGSNLSVPGLIPSTKIVAGARDNGFGLFIDDEYINIDQIQPSYMKINQMGTMVSVITGDRLLIYSDICKNPYDLIGCCATDDQFFMYCPNDNTTYTINEVYYSMQFASQCFAENQTPLFFNPDGCAQTCRPCTLPYSNALCKDPEIFSSCCHLEGHTNNPCDRTSAEILGSLLSPGSFLNTSERIDAGLKPFFKVDGPDLKDIDSLLDKS